VTQSRSNSLITPRVPSISEPQLDAYTYVAGSLAGSNITAAWQISSGAGASVALIDDGFTPSEIADFDTAQSISFAGGAATDLSEPAGAYHGTTTSGLIGASGSLGPMGLAPNAAIIGVKVTFGSVSFAPLVQALGYAASVADVVNNSWGFTGYGIGSYQDPSFAGWYATLQQAVGADRGGLGAVIVFAAGNDRSDADDLALQPIPADPEAIAVAATNADGSVANFSDPGAALLVAALGVGVAVPVPPGLGSYAYGSGTSYSAPTVAAIAAMMLAVNPLLGWRDVQQILASSAYMPAAAASGFTVNGAATWNGGGMHFSDDLGFGVVDAKVAVELARVWTEQSDSANEATATATQTAPFALPVDAAASSLLGFTAPITIQHVQVSFSDTDIPVAATELVLYSPDGTRSVLMDQPGDVGGQDQTGGMDLNGTTITSNAFWGETAAGTWTLQAIDSGGTVVGTMTGWSLTVEGDLSPATPLIFTPEFPALAAADPARTDIATGGATTLDLIALPGSTTLNLNGGAGTIDGIPVTLGRGLTDANAAGSTGVVILTAASSGSRITGGDYQTTVYGDGGDDTVIAGLGVTTIVAGHDPKMTFVAGSGRSVAFSGSGQLDLYLGSGYDRLSIYEGNGGDDILSGFLPGTDVIELYNYASGAAATALQNQTSDGASGTLLRFSDGTQVDLLGISHATSSFFVAA
jgi:subtilisin-like proprotein convertase family protein